MENRSIHDDVWLAPWNPEWAREFLRAKYRYTKHLLECEYPDNRELYREMKGMFISDVLGGYRQALAHRTR